MKKVVLTGEFLTDINQIKDTLFRYEFEVIKNLDDSVSFLIVGDACKSYWATSRTGILIHEVTRLELKGKKIEILYEAELHARLISPNQQSIQL